MFSVCYTLCIHSIFVSLRCFLHNILLPFNTSLRLRLYSFLAPWSFRFCHLLGLSCATYHNITRLRYEVRPHHCTSWLFIFFGFAQNLRATDNDNGVSGLVGTHVTHDVREATFFFSTLLLLSFLLLFKYPLSACSAWQFMCVCMEKTSFISQLNKYLYEIRSCD